VYARNRINNGKSSESVQCTMLKACDACGDMGALYRFGRLSLIITKCARMMDKWLTGLFLCEHCEYSCHCDSWQSAKAVSELVLYQIYLLIVSFCPVISCTAIRYVTG